MDHARRLVMPKLGLTMTEGLVSEWCVSEGEKFEANATIVVIETDKVSHEVEAPSAGTLERILVGQGETVPVSTELAEWRLAGALGHPTQPERRDEKPAAAASRSEVLSAIPQERNTHADKTFVRATPLARRIARTQSISLGEVMGSGPNGRIVADDVHAAIEAKRDVRSTSPASSLVLRCERAPSPMERAMANLMGKAKREIPHFYLSVGLEIGALLSLRIELNKIPNRPRLSLTHLLATAIVRALEATPHMNRVWEDDKIISFQSIDIGIAVQTDNGLFNPIVKNLGGKSFYDIATRIDDAVHRARNGTLGFDDFQGGATTISNAGMHDVRYVTSIIPPTHSSIIGVGSVQEIFRPDEAGAPRLRRELGIVLSADHRVHTGVGGLQFLDEVRRQVASPLSLITTV